MSKIFTPEPIHRVRKAERASYDWEVMGEIIDAIPIGHVGFMEAGEVFVIPLNVWRMDEHLYLHCLTGGRLQKLFTDQRQCCISFAEHNAWVLSKSAYHTSANYRSVVVYGHFSEVTEDGEFNAAFEAFLDSIEPGRWDRVRPISEKERKVTSLLRFAICSGSAKQRSGPAREEDADLAISVPAGIIPLTVTRGDIEGRY